MPRFRPDLESIPTYDPGPPLSTVATRLGLSSIADLGSNEHPVEPFPEVLAAMATAAPGVNRYPLTDAPDLAAALGSLYGVDSDFIWVAPGSTNLLISAALAATGPGFSVVFADPSFVMYRTATAIAGAIPIAVPVDTAWRLDTSAMIDAVRADTNLIFYCNPNNPTGTHNGSSEVDRLVNSVPDRVTIVIDEAYAEYVSADDWSTAIVHATTRPNVLVSRTFSKVYGLAGERVGYAIGDPALIRALSRPQPPYAVSTLAQVAATEALRHQDLIAQRVADTVVGREWIAASLRRLGQSVIDSQTNFVLWRPTDSTAAADILLRSGTLARALGPWVRITVGTTQQNEHCLATIEEAVAAGTM